MSGVGNYQIGVLTQPAVGSALNSSVILSQFQTIRTQHNAHDSDPAVHVRSDTLALRPAAGQGGIYVTTDTKQVFVDTGAAWAEAAYAAASSLANYLPLAGGTLSGALTGTSALFSAGVTVSAGGITVTGNSTVTGSLTLGGGLTFATDNTYDIGAAAANRPRNIYIAGSGTVSGGLTVSGTGLSVAAGGATISGATSVTGNLTVSGLVSITDSAAAGQYGVTISGTAGAARDILLVGQTGQSNGFTVQWNGAAMVYIMANGSLSIGGDISAADGHFSRTTNTGYVYLGSDRVHSWGFNGTDFIGNAGLNIGGRIVFSTDNAYDIGAAAANRPRNIYVATSVVAPTFTGALSGNASTATALQTPRAINGVNFDGTAAITVTAAAGTLTGTTLAAGVTASSLTSVGTLTSLNLGGGLTFATDNTYDIGAAAATRPRNIYAAGTIYSASARALKEQIRPTTLDALAVVRGVRVVDFRYKASPDRAKIGFIADDTDEILSGPARKDFDLNNAIGVLLRAVQQLADRCEALEHRRAA